MTLTSQPLTALVPAKGRGGKSRLSPVLNAHERARLSRWMLACVLDALRASSDVGAVRVVGRDPALDALARVHGAAYVRERAASLNGALQHEFDRCLVQHGRALIAFGDLPLLGAAAVDALVAAGSRADLVLAPDRRGRGTNALLYRGEAPLDLCYGPDSFPRYLERARRAGLTVEVVRDPALMDDLDTPADWARLRSSLARLGFASEASSAAR